MFVLTEVEKIAIISGCVGLLLVVIGLTICFVCPFCWLHKARNRQKLKKDAEFNLFWNHLPESFLNHDPPPPYEPSRKNSFFEMQSQFNFHKRLTPMNSISTCCSDTDSVTGIPLPAISDLELPTSKSRESSLCEPGNVSITLQFKRIEGDDKKIYSYLRVDMKEAADLPIRAYGGNCDPYFKVGLYDKNIKKRKKKKSEVLPFHEFKTTIIKKSHHPVYSESFFFPLDPKLLKKRVLKFEAWDQVKWANDTALGEVYFNLKNVASVLSEEPSRELDLNLKLENSKQNNGQLLLGICYLPTSERMTIAILKANNLKSVNESDESAGLYVKALAIYGGKVFDRRKTSCRPTCSSPVFNEMLMFDVPFSKLDHVALVITIRSETKVTHKQQKTTKDECIGKAVVSSYSRKASHHWNAMKKSPRRQVIEWHELR